jgi:hypothetical protein
MGAGRGRHPDTCPSPGFLVKKKITKKIRKSNTY